MAQQFFFTGRVASYRVVRYANQEYGDHIDIRHQESKRGYKLELVTIRIVKLCRVSTFVELLDSKYPAIWEYPEDRDAVSHGPTV